MDDRPGGKSQGIRKAHEEFAPNLPAVWPDPLVSPDPSWPGRFVVANDRQSSPPPPVPVVILYLDSEVKRIGVALSVRTGTS